LAIVPRNDRFHVLLSADERSMLDQLSDRDGVKGAAVFRRLLREAFEASGLTLPKTSTKKRS
jgi:hypothetical protein